MNHTEFLPLLEKLISFQSTAARPEQTAACAAFIRNWLAEYSLPHLALEHNGVPSILAGLDKMDPEEKQPPILLLAHFDVVDGTAEQFAPRREGNLLHGRGSVDDKYAVALSLLLLREHWKSRPAGRTPSFMVLLTGDEEAGGNNGAGYASAMLRPQFCLALDGGSPGEVITRQKGVLRLALTEVGRTAHGARPWLGDNAALKLARDCLAVSDLFSELETPAAPFDYWHPTCNIGLIRSGSVVNQVPDSARADFDVRYTEMHAPDNLLLAIESVVQGRLELLANIPPLMPLPSPYLDLLLECTAETGAGSAAGGLPGKPARLGVGHGASDAQFFSQRNIPCAVWGAEGDSSQHGPAEHLHIDSAEQIMRTLDLFLKKANAF